MLEEVRIRDLGVIGDAVLELGPGFTVLTGETGAGKTMVVTGLGLLLGGKADAGAVRTGAASALVEGRIVLPPGSAPLARAAEAGAELDDGALLVSRTVSGSRSRAFLGGRSVPAAVLAELADDLVAVHGQSDQHRLLRPARQREALDRYAGDAVAAPLADYASRWARLRQVEATLEELVTRRREREQEAELLRLGLERIEQVDPKPGEDLALREEDERLGNADELRISAATAHAALLGDPDAQGGPDAVALVDAARRALEAARAHDPALGALADRLAESTYLLSDLAADLAAYQSGVDADPRRLAAVQERRAVLSGLTRVYGATVDEVLEWSRRAAARLDRLEGADDEVQALQSERTRLRHELGALAGRLSRARTEAADRLATAITEELGALAMPRAQVQVAVRQHDDAEGLEVEGRTLAASASGVDEVELLLEANPGAAARPLGKGASGGELSRVMLALEVALAGADPVPTFVFDEVDAGVGGKAAVEIGRRLAALSRTAQVLVVTHLPQVAAHADRHLVVVKDDDGSVTRSGVTTLDEEGRVGELARMLAGQEESETARAHAVELLGSARSPAPARRRR
ncbi:DNA repair protein RecN (Recombination protein N) [Motilibacter peucedani]|uniref:DNA repair protein RecN n=1 Tax=Motilibacter peucedani TaxID=598650 RepID=A0A420XSP6_9ACTN|nr:DNA repair protein RecN [Motilibacter peucedani]RKS77850.1 DNA repair protein RecN (Recombination protein N) [Motilibacter peucedani]